MDDQIFSIFANKTRLKLLVCLSQGEKNVTELIKNCGLSQSAVSQHLEKMRSTGIVSTRREGKEIIYSLIDPKAADISSELLKFAKGVNV